MKKKIIVSKAGIGQDSYDWDDVALEFDHGVLVVRDEHNGHMIHAYSAARWLDVTVVEP